jgi:hypothetical protein
MKSLMWLVAFGVGVYFIGMAVLGRGEDREVWATRVTSHVDQPERVRSHHGPVRMIVHFNQEETFGDPTDF